MNVEINMGEKDRAIRSTAATAIVTLTAAGLLKGRLSKVLLAVSAIFFITSNKGWCPLYAAVGVNSITEREEIKKLDEKVFDIL